MCEVMLNVVNFWQPGRVGKALPQQGGCALPRDAITRALQNCRQLWSFLQEVSQFGAEIGAVVLIKRDTVNVIYRDAGLRKAVLDGLGWKARPVLDATETLLFSCGD